MKKFSFFAMAASLMFGLASCSTDAPNEPGKVLENETKTFVKISLVSTDGDMTRAAEGEADDDQFETGIDSENSVKNVLLVFYDEAEKYVGNARIKVDEADKDLSYVGADDDLTIARALTTVAEVNLPENTNHPAYVVAFVNPTRLSDDLSNIEKMSDLTKVIRQRSDVSINGMTMNNSVYYDEALGQPVFATRVDFTKQFFKTEDDAKKSTENIINITVERVQAKVVLSNLAELVKENSGKIAPFKSSETNPEYTLQFVPEKWFVNATEKNTFLIKNYRSGSTNYTDITKLADFSGFLDFNTLKNDRFNVGDNRHLQFNEPRRLRSYWALDPTYFFTEEGQYPSISYDVSYVNQAGNTINNNNDAKAYPLSYRSYNDIPADLSKQFEYCLENTMNVATLKSARAKSALTSVVMLGHYEIKDKNNVVVFDGSTSDKTFYIRHDSDKDKTILLDDNAAKDYFLEHSGAVLYVKVPKLNQDGSESATEFEMQPLTAAHVKNGVAGTAYSDFKLVHPTRICSAEGADVLGQAVVSEQWRTLTFASENNAILNKYYIYEQVGPNGYDYVPLDKDRLHTIHKNLYSAFGLVESFKNGKAYFNVPLKHIFYNPALYDENKASNDFDAEKAQLGDYGVVRNHVYQLTINGIQGLGSGIGDLNQPIVPPTEVDNYYIAAKLNILKWRIVSQSVDL